MIKPLPNRLIGHSEPSRLHGGRQCRSIACTGHAFGGVRMGRILIAIAAIAAAVACGLPAIYSFEGLRAAVHTAFSVIDVGHHAKVILLFLILANALLTITGLQRALGTRQAKLAEAGLDDDHPSPVVRQSIKGAQGGHCHCHSLGMES